MNKLKKNILSLPPLSQLVSESQLTFRKSLGQNFIYDINLTRKIARQAKPLDSGSVIEVGPGPGALTRALLIEGAREVIAIEKDARAIKILSQLEELAHPRLKIINGDALKIELTSLGNSPRQIVANLPYNIATRLIIDWLQTSNNLAAITVMVQREVAKRLCAEHGDPDYGRLAVIVRLLAEPNLLFEVPAAAFIPKPKVTSAVVQLLPRNEPLFKVDMLSLEKITRAAFGKRRKMLRSSLKEFGGTRLLEQAYIPPTERPENLTVESFCRLADLYSSQTH